MDAPNDTPAEGGDGSRHAVVCDIELEEIIPSYLAGRRAACPVIRELTERGELEQVRNIAHGMKGSGGCYGFTGISDIGRDMEAAAKAGARDEVLRQLGALERYLGALEVRYE